MDTKTVFGSRPKYSITTIMANIKQFFSSGPEICSEVKFVYTVYKTVTSSFSEV